MDQKKVAVVDDHPFMRLAIKGVLEQNGYKVTIEADNGADAINLLRVNPVNYLIIDLDIPKIDGLNAIKRIKVNSPDTKIIVFTGMNVNIYTSRCISAGVSGIVSKADDIDHLVDTLKMVSRGHIIYPSINSTQSEEQSISLLSDRELSIAKLLYEGKNNTVIAKELVISPKTVSAHKNNILAKLNINSLSELIAFFQRNDL